jgi:stage III sporulation protein SpoIIIAA
VLNGRVEAQYKGKGGWFKGKLRAVNADGTYDVLFDDRSADVAVRPESIRATAAVEEQAVAQVRANQSTLQVSEGNSADISLQQQVKAIVGNESSGIMGSQIHSGYKIKHGHSLKEKIKSLGYAGLEPFMAMIAGIHSQASSVAECTDRKYSTQPANPVVKKQLPVNLLNPPTGVATSSTDAATQIYLSAIKSCIQEHGGSCDISEAGQVVKPKGGIPGKLTNFLGSFPDQFTLTQSEHTCIVCLSSAGAQNSKPIAHKFRDVSLCKMFQTLVALNNMFKGRRWPTTRQELKKWLAGIKEISGSNREELICNLTNGPYCKISGGKSLTWNHEHIQDALRKMSASLAVPASISEPGTTPAPSQKPKPAPSVNTISRCSSPVFVSSESMLRSVLSSEPAFVSPDTQQYVAIDCKGGTDCLALIIIVTSGLTYVFDCVTLGTTAVIEPLQPLFSSTCKKIVHNLHQDAFMLAKYMNIADGLLNCIDTQLAAECLWGGPRASLKYMSRKLDVKETPNYAMRTRMEKLPDCWSRRPFRPDAAGYAAEDATLLLNAWPLLIKLAEEQCSVGDLVGITADRASSAVRNAGRRSVAFDIASDHRQASAELVRYFRPDDAYAVQPMQIQTDVDDVLGLLPDHLLDKLRQDPSEVSKLALNYGFALASLSDVIFDIGRRPHCWVRADGKQERQFLSDDDRILTTTEDIAYIRSKVGRFGSDHRAGLDRKLHRISAMFNRDGSDVAGITIRLGRSVKGNADMLVDILLGSDKCVLVLGAPGSGKTTIVREATRILAESQNVVVVDTSNEIAGDGLIPHQCIGFARRMMVPSLDQQSDVMVECVQNHTPDVMVIDEIGRPKEVKAARTVKQRGVRIVASAHGDLRGLLKNAELRDLVGGINVVTMGDAMAKEEAAKRGGGATASKTKSTRGGEPTFEIIVELRQGELHEWRVVTDSAGAVDAILEGREYVAEQRTRNPASGEVFVDTTRA